MSLTSKTQQNKKSACFNILSQILFLSLSDTKFIAHPSTAERGKVKSLGWLQFLNTMTTWRTLQQSELKQTSLSTDGEKRVNVKDLIILKVGGGLTHNNMKWALRGDQCNSQNYVNKPALFILQEVWIKNALPAEAKHDLVSFDPNHFYLSAHQLFREIRNWL